MNYSHFTSGTNIIGDVNCVESELNRLLTKFSAHISFPEEYELQDLKKIMPIVFAVSVIGGGKTKRTQPTTTGNLKN